MPGFEPEIKIDDLDWISEVLCELSTEMVITEIEFGNLLNSLYEL